MIKICDLTKHYGNTVIIEKVSYFFEDDMIYGIVGVNGAGKTTLLNAISRFDTQNTGKIYIGDKEITNKDFLDIPMSYVMDNPFFFNELTVKENLMLICASKSYRKKECTELIEHLLTEFKMKKYENYYPLNLSKGTFQRLNIACALIRKEKVCLMDEPFSGLDPVQSSALEKIILDFNRRFGGTYIISSHDIESLKNICGKCLVVSNKKISEISMEKVSREEISKLLNGDNNDD